MSLVLARRYSLGYPVCNDHCLVQRLLTRGVTDRGAQAWTHKDLLSAPAYHSSAHRGLQHADRCIATCKIFMLQPGLVSACPEAGDAYV